MRTCWEKPFYFLGIKIKDQWSKEDTDYKDKIMKWNQNCEYGGNIYVGNIKSGRVDASICEECPAQCPVTVKSILHKPPLNV